MRRELARVIDELIGGNLPPGRRYEKLATGHNLYSVRLNQAYRFVFQLYPDSSTASCRGWSPRRRLPSGPHSCPQLTADGAVARLGAFRAHAQGV